MFADFDLPGDDCSAIKVFVRRNGTTGPLKEVSLPPYSKLSDLFDKACKVLDIEAPRFAFYSNGVECTDCDNMEEDEVIHISCGEPFKASEAPSARKKVVGNFILHEMLGQGGFGSVIKGVHSETGEFAAVKFVPKSSFRQISDLQRVFQEIQAMRNLKHPNVIRILDVADHPDSICFIMEFAAGGELRGYVERMSFLSEEESRNFFKQIVRAVHYIHSKKIIHRDLKLENILLDGQNRCKIVDFGLSDYVSSKERTVTDAGTEAYLAPEVYNGSSKESDPYKIDVWGLGVIMYALSHGKLPFSRPDEETCAKLDADGLNFKDAMTPGYRRLVKMQLTPNPERRASMNEITLDTWVTKHRFASCDILGVQFDDEDALDVIEDEVAKIESPTTPEWLSDPGLLQADEKWTITATQSEEPVPSEPTSPTGHKLLLAEKHIENGGRRQSDVSCRSSAGSVECAIANTSPRPGHRAYQAQPAGARVRQASNHLQITTEKTGKPGVGGDGAGVARNGHLPRSAVTLSPGRADSRGAALRRAGAGVGASVAR